MIMFKDKAAGPSLKPTNKIPPKLPDVSTIEVRGVGFGHC
jgi:hypothetical protein